jgi:hypothetical protein
MSERGEYASIPKVLLDGPDYQRLPPNARLVFLSLCLSFNGVGIEVRYPEAIVAELGAQTGMSADALRLAMDVLEHENWLKREGNVMWLVGRLDHSGLTLANAKKHVPHVRKILLGLPRLSIVREFVLKYRAWFEDDGKLIDSLSWVGASLSKRYRKGTDRLSIANQYPTDSQELPKNFPNQTNMSGADAPANWVAAAVEAFLPLGNFTHGRVGKALAPVVKLYGWADTERGVGDYVRAPKNGRARTPEYFAQESGTWVVGAREPLVDDAGVPTERANRLVGAH